MAPERILVIEDDPDVRDTVCTALQALYPKASVTALSSGHEFLRVFDDRMPQAWHLVVLDMMLPGLSGIEICERIRTCRGGESIPILAMTGYDTPEMEDRVRRSGATHYMAKPFDMKDFRKALDEMTRRAR